MLSRSKSILAHSPLSGACVFLLLFLLLPALTLARQRYDRYRLFDYQPLNARHVRLMHAIHQQFAEEGSGVVDFWREARAPNRTGTFMASPRVARQLAQSIRAAGIRLHRRSSNVQRLVDGERRQNRFQNFFTDVTMLGEHTSYMRYEQIKSWLQDKVKRCRQCNQCHQCTRCKRCTLQAIGKSGHGRDLLVVRISKGGTKNRPLIWIDAGIHPREWIAPATAMFLIEKLLENNNEAERLLDRFDIVILPLMNPDGYEYTHTHSRFWRKNLQPSNRYCKGVDLNRNFGYEWGGSGSSSNPCADNYRGKGPFSEPETSHVNEFLKKHKRKIIVFLTLHAYGQYILIPFGNRKTFYPANRRQLMRLGNNMARQIEVFAGRSYDVGSAADLLYEAAGGSTDYASANLHIPYTYTVELPDTGRYAFFLPPQYIIQVGREMWIALQEVAKTV